MAVAKLDRLTYTYPGAKKPSLRDVTLCLDGGLTVVTGPSGGGKSTLLRVFNGLVPHFHGGRISGHAEVAGRDIVATPTCKLARDVGFVFQDPELQTVYATADREVAFGLENIAVSPRDIPGRVVAALDEAGVGHLAGRLMRTLSGGERQRVALASALAMNPSLVVLDEPTSQLDPDGATLVLAAVRRIVREGRGVIISEHRPEPLLDDAQRFLVVEEGRVEVTGRVRTPPPPRMDRHPAAGAEAWRVRSGAAGFDGRLVLEDVDIAGAAGEVVALMGPNGGGKTTLLRLIAGLQAPLAGAVERRPGRIAYLPQNPAALLHRPSVRAEVQFTIDRAGDDNGDRAQTILDQLGLREVADRYPRDLSSGERQRAALAAVLTGRPQLVLLDEPTRGMDVASRQALVRLVSSLRDRGAAMVIATHDSDLRAAVADRVVRVGSGRALELAAEVQYR